MSPTLISMWWLKEPYMMLLLFTTTANKTQVVDMFFVYKKPLASSRQLSCFRQLWYGWWNPRCRWHHHDFCFSTSVLDIYVQKLRMTQLTQSDWPILLQKVDTGQCTSPPLTQSRVIFSISCSERWSSSGSWKSEATTTSSRWSRQRVAFGGALCRVDRWRRG